MRINEEEKSFLTKKKQMKHEAFMWVLRRRGQGQMEKKERESGELQHRKQLENKAVYLPITCIPDWCASASCPLLAGPSQ